jgi:lipid-A-disaccharide synthase
MKQPKKIFISTGEISGELHAKHLIQALHALSPHAIAITQLTGDPRLSTIGFLEPILHIPRILYRFHTLQKKLIKEKPDLIVAIDYQGFNLPLLKIAKKLGIKTAYYISPQEWQWGTEKGGKAVIAATDLILAIFKEEAEFYKKLGGNVHFVGHPLLAIAKPTCTPEEFREKYNIPNTKKIIAIFAGSRPQEIKNVFPTLLEVAKNCQKKLGNIQLIISIASDTFKEEIQKISPQDAIFNTDSSYNLMNAATLSLAPSGTITLELAILGKPAIIGYKFNPISLWIAKKLYGERLKRIIYISLPNLIFKKHVLPEFFQDQCEPKRMTEKALSLLTDKEKYDALSNELHTITPHLGQEKDAPHTAARHILELLT